MWKFVNDTEILFWLIKIEKLLVNRSIKKLEQSKISIGNVAQLNTELIDWFCANVLQEQDTKNDQQCEGVI